MDDPLVSIIIVNWNGWKDTLECLESLFQIDYPNFNIIVVDNASEDDSILKIREYCSGHLEVKSPFFDYDHENKPIHLFEYNNHFNNSNNIESTDNSLILIKNDENKGFPGGNNIGIKFALKYFNPDYILLLNNDTVVAEDFLNELVKNGESRENVGILGPKIYYYDKPNVIWSAGCKLSWKLCRGIQIGCKKTDHGQYDAKKEVEYVSGSAFLIKKEVIQKIGLMDETYFLYFEESDWTLKANKAGYKSLYVPQARVWHKISRSGGGISKPLGLYYITRNRWIFMKKWGKKSDYWFFVIDQLIMSISLPIFLAIYYKNLSLVSAYYRGLTSGIGNINLKLFFLK